MHSFDLVIYVLAAALTLAAYLRDPSLPGVGFRTGGQLLLDVLPRLIGALIMTGMLQVLIAPEWIQPGSDRGRPAARSSPASWPASSRRAARW
jgi:hypothetical protein